MNKKSPVIKLIFLAIGIVFINSCQSSKPIGPYFASGIKIGEVTQNEAIIWVRLTENPARIGMNAPLIEVKYINPESNELIERKGRPDLVPVVSFPEGYSIKTIQGASPGSEGKVRLKYKVKSEKEWKYIDWKSVLPEKDFTYQFELSELMPGNEYMLIVEASPLKGENISTSLEGEFKTAPSPDVPSDVNFIVTTGTSYTDIDSETGYKLYPNSLKLDPEFFVHTGDIIYYDFLGKTPELALWHWDRMYSLQNNIDFHRQVSSYFIKDDHDTWMDDCYLEKETDFMGEFTYEQGTQLFLDEVPMGEKTYRTISWGKDLQIWLIEGRDYRSPNTMPDGPEKTILGKEQMEWLRSTMEDSEASFKVLISPTPIVGPDRKGKKDNYSNSNFNYEGELLREFLSEQNMVVVCGDRHWQYISQDEKTGLLEFSCGPGSNAHAGGWSQENKLPEHIYLNVTGGFMEGAVTQMDGKPILIFRHYNPDGKLLNEYKMESE